MSCTCNGGIPSNTLTTSYLVETAHCGILNKDGEHYIYAKASLPSFGQQLKPRTIEIMFFTKQAVNSLLQVLLAGSVAADVNAGFNVDTAQKVMTDKASHSWEWGTAAEGPIGVVRQPIFRLRPQPFPKWQNPHPEPIDLLAFLRQTTYQPQLASPRRQLCRRRPGVSRRIRHLAGTVGLGLQWRCRPRSGLPPQQGPQI